MAVVGGQKGDAMHRRAATRFLRTFFIALLFGITHCKDAGKNKITLTFVVDSTGSMTDDINQVKDAMQDIFDYLKTNRADEIENYALVEFNDPEAELKIITSNAREYRRVLQTIVASGGGDCAEMSLKGLKIALERSLPYSYIFAFTDASAKDHLRKEEIENLIQRKKSKIVFVLTGKCGSESQPDYMVYHTIARISNGYVFDIHKDEVKKVLEFIKLDTGRKDVVQSGSIANGHESLHVPVDKSISEITVTVTGQKPKINLKNPDGEITAGRNILDLESAVSKQVDHPESGIWTVDVAARPPGRFVITAETSFNFKYGFSQNPTQEISDTSPRPLAGVKNELLIKVLNNTSSVQLTQVKVKDDVGKHLMTIKLHPLRSQTGIFKADSFLPPNSPFLMEVHGEDEKKNTIIRLSDSGITPQQPAQPIINLPSELTATLKSPFTLRCHVESLVPFSGTWRKGGINLVPETKFPQSTTMNYSIAKTTVSTEGTYTCKATNQAGSTSRDVKLKIKGPPPAVRTPKIVHMILKEEGEIPCQVESDVAYEVRWEKYSISGTFFPVRTSKASVKNGHLMITRADKEDEGRYMCSAKSIFGEGSSEVNVEVVEPATVIVSPDQEFTFNESFQISCHASGTPKINLLWKKDGVIIPESDERLRRMDGNVLLYTFEHSQQSDEGIYECSATNKANSASGVTTLRYIQVLPQIESKEGSEEITLIVGQAKELTCNVVQGIPKPSLTWYKDGEKLVEEDSELRGATAFSNGSLVLSYAKPENEGTYECEAENVAGKAKKTFQLTVLEPPTFGNEKHEILKVKSGLNISVPCGAYGNPKPTIYWRKDGAYLTASSSNIAFKSDGHSIFIMVSNPENNGTYECVAANAAGRKSYYIDLLVQGAPRISPQSTSIYREKGKKITLKCIVKAYPVAKIEWKKNGNPFNSRHVSYGENNSTLRIQQADLSSSGSYECIASNAEGQDHLTINVSVTVAPFFASAVEFIKVSEGETVTLSCETDAVPPAKYNWTEDSDEEPIGNDSSITFEKVDVNFPEIYYCDAINSAGSARKQFVVIVYSPPRIITNSSEKYIVKIGSNFSMECIAEGRPTPDVRWLGNGTIVTQIEGFAKIMPEDEGIYTCIAENYAGTDQRNVQIILEAPPTMGEVYPQIIEVQASKSVTISCPAMGGYPPPAIEWAKNGLKIRSIRRVIPRGKNLELHRISLDDEGSYSCIASNTAGRAQANIIVNVLRTPLFLSGKNHQTINGIIGMSIKLSCSSSGKPTPKVSWFRNNHPFVQFLSPQATLESDNHILRINNASKTDEGVYKCVVENNAGSTQRSFDLKLSTHREDKDGPREWGQWSSWSQCSSPCGHSEQVRVRQCNSCSGESEEWRKCFVGGCKVDGNWSKWGAWTECTATCGSSVRYRERSCSNPPPLHGGAWCYGANRQHETCNKDPCPIDGSWSEWSEWHDCSGSCTKSVMKRKRICNKPSFGGKSCVGNGTEYKPCIKRSCPVDGGWSKWSKWSACSASCGPSLSIRKRSCNKPTPKMNGLLCKGNDTETRKCDSFTCDNIPLHWTMKFIGSLNGQDFPEQWYSVNVTDLEGIREVKSIFLNPLNKKALPIWYPLFPHFVSPVIWLTAFQKDKAINGYTLTGGVFEMLTTITFKTGENVSIHHTKSGSVGTFNLQAYIEGQLPLFKNYISGMNSYEETYIQIGPGELFVTSKSTHEENGATIPYTWTKSIKYKKELGSLPSLSEKLTVHVLKGKGNLQQGLISMISGSCPSGFEHSELGFCSDVDECSNRRLHNCHPTQSCINLIGSYQCSCPRGFDASRKGEKCADVNECTKYSSLCSHWCENFPGSFKCLCPPGLALQESKTNCTDIVPKPTPIYGESVSEKLCLPSQREQDGICRASDPCHDDRGLCREGEVCVNERGFAQCISLPCPDGFTRIRNTQCIKNCSSTTCDTRAIVSETISYVVLQRDRPIAPFTRLTHLQWEARDHSDEVTFHILKNEKGKPFHVRTGILFSTQFLPSGRTYSVEVLASIYKKNGSEILFTNKFLVTIYTLDIV